MWAARIGALIAAAVSVFAQQGDAGRGQAIVEGKGGCLGCHRIKGNGSRTGPDLSEIGARQTDQLRTSLIDPDAEIAPANRLYRVVLKDGTAVTGRLMNQDTFTVQMIDSRESLRSFTKSDLREFAFVEKSPMPSFKDRLSALELADVIEYLSSLKPPPPPPGAGRGGRGPQP